jgi:hypothetical protein
VKVAPGEIYVNNAVIWLPRRLPLREYLTVSIELDFLPLSTEHSYSPVTFDCKLDSVLQSNDNTCSPDHLLPLPAHHDAPSVPPSLNDTACIPWRFCFPSFPLRSPSSKRSQHGIPLPLVHFPSFSSHLADSNVTTSCPTTAPCCSEFGFCGSTEAVCPGVLFQVPGLMNC